MGQYARIGLVASLILILMNAFLLPNFRIPIRTGSPSPSLSATLNRNIRDWHYGDFTNGTPNLYYLGERRFGLSEHSSHHLDFEVLSLLNLDPELKLSLGEAELLFYYWNRTTVGLGIYSKGTLAVFEGEYSMAIFFNRSIVASGGVLVNNTRVIGLIDSKGSFYFTSFNRFGSLSFVESPLDFFIGGSVDRTSLAFENDFWKFMVFGHNGNSFYKYSIYVDQKSFKVTNVEVFSYWSGFQEGADYEGVFPAPNGLVMGFSVFEDSLDIGYRYRVVLNSSEVSFVSNKSLLFTQINDTIVFYSFEEGVYVDGIPLSVWMVFVRLASGEVILLPRDPNYGYIYSRMQSPLLGTFPVYQSGAAFLFTGTTPGMELFLVLSLGGGSREYYAQQAAALESQNPFAFLEYFGYSFWLIIPAVGWLLDVIEKRRRLYPALYPLMVEEERLKRRQPPP